MTGIRSASVARERLLRIPITGSCCCARAARGHAAAPQPNAAIKSRRLMCLPSGRPLHPITFFERCASQQNWLPIIRFGSFSIEPPASSPVMSAVAPITTEFCAPQRTAVSARTGREQVQQRSAVRQSHSITSSASASSWSGTASPMAFAAWRLITSSNLVGCSTGNSAGCAPLRIISTYSAARRYICRRSTP
jgi:hypothetical protein